jgi:multiple sugar transport system permease protein
LKTSRLRALAALLLGLIFIGPLVFMALGSLRPPGLPPPSGFEFLPESPTFGNFEIASRFVPIARQVLNSILVVAFAVPLSVLVASLTGFAIVHRADRFSRIVLAVVVVTWLIPTSLLWVPRFIIFKYVGLTDSLAPLIAPSLLATSPFYVLLFALAYRRIDPAVFEAARLDGWSEFSIWRLVAWPLARATALAVAVLAFVVHWSNFADPLIYLSDTDLFTLPLGLRSLQTLEPANFPILLAAACIASVPPIVAFFLAQKALFAKTLDVR